VKTKICIIGGGLAGLTAAIDLAQKGHQVTVIEKDTYPKHKVCGEYISNEVLSYLNKINFPLSDLKPALINHLKLTNHKAQIIETNLPLGGFGLSRYTFDHALAEHAIKNGADLKIDSVQNIAFSHSTDHFTINCKSGFSVESKIVIGAYGKRSKLDKSINRDFITKKSPWIAFKAHYDMPDFPDKNVELHHFKKGYCGLSKTETGAVNFCYLAHNDIFKNYKKIDDFNEQILAQNPYLAGFLQRAKPIFKKPLGIAQIAFTKKPLVENHILMCGDTAGLIHPLCGNGMAMAIHSAKILAQNIDRYFKNELNRRELEKIYINDWSAVFKTRMKAGRTLQHLIVNENWNKLAFYLVKNQPKILKPVIQLTHGKAF